jgi:hypothetical protein
VTLWCVDGAETARLIYVSNMLVIACCDFNTITTQTISYHSKRIAQSFSEFGSGS